MVTKKIQDFFLNNPNIKTPILVFDLQVLENKYLEFKRIFNDVEVFYAVKCNPAIHILEKLKDLGSSFDVASIEEVDLCLSIGIDPKKISWGSTIKKPYLVKKAYEKGVKIFACDSFEDLEGIADNAPNSQVYCRVLVSNDNALWPLSSKFGCTSDMAEEIIIEAKQKGLIPIGISFHVGSQQLNLEAWDIAISTTAKIFANLEKNHNIKLEMVNIGGGYPAYGYITQNQPLESYADTIYASFKKNFGEVYPKIFAEPGRFLVADAGVLKSEIVLVSQKDKNADDRWVYLDVGIYGGLAEALGECIKYNILTSKDDDKNKGAVNLAGPTCDGMDILYKNYKYQMPMSLKTGDVVYILSTGAYTTSYSSINFNGFKPLKDYYID